MPPRANVPATADNPPERTVMAEIWSPYRTGHVMGDWRDLYMNIRPEAGNHVRMDAFAALQLITKAAYTIQLFDELQSYLVSEYETTTEYHTFFDHMCEYTLLCHLKKVYEAMPKVPSIQVLHSKILAYSTTMRDAYEGNFNPSSSLQDTDFRIPSLGHRKEIKPKLQKLRIILNELLEPSFIRALCTQQEAAFLSKCSHFASGYLPHDQIEKDVCRLVIALRDDMGAGRGLAPNKILGLLPETPHGLLPRIPRARPGYNETFWDFRESYAYRPPIGVLRSHIMNSLRLSVNRGGRYQRIRKPTMKSGALRWVLATDGDGSTEGEDSHRVFIDWLRVVPEDSTENATAQKNIFWVSGHPGSGKSVLMRMIVDSVLHDRSILKPIKNLRDRNPIVLFHFYQDRQDPFYDAHRYMLNDLLLQLFEQEPLMVDSIFMQRWYKLLGMSDVDVPLPSYIPREAWEDNLIPTENSHWSTKWLEEYFIAALTGLDSFRPVYIFLDGPSGFTTQTWEDNKAYYFHFPMFIETIRNIQPWHKVKDMEQAGDIREATPVSNSIKIIVASRPEKDLHDFHLPRKIKKDGLLTTVGVEATMLRVQDINGNDMKLICRHRFGMLEKDYSTRTPKWRQMIMEEAVEEIVREANGCYQVLQDALDGHPATKFNEARDEESSCWSWCFPGYETESKEGLYDEDLELGKLHGDDVFLEQGRTDAGTSLPRTFNLYSSMLSQICWFNQLSDSRSISYHLNLILAHNHSHRFTSARLKNRPLSLLEIVLAGGDKLTSSLYPSTETVDLLWQSCNLTVNKINQGLYPFVTLKDMEPDHQVTAPKASKFWKDKTEYEQNNYADLLPFANRALVPIHPRFLDFLITMPEGIELLNRDCRCEDKAFEPDENGKMVCKCTPANRLKWHQKRIKKLLCASVFEHRFLLPSVNDLRPIYKKHVQLIESSKELCHLADAVEGDEQIVHLTTAQEPSSSNSRGGVVKAFTVPYPSARTQAVPSRSAPIPWDMKGNCGRKEGWFPREWVDEFSREQKGLWERLWGGVYFWHFWHFWHFWQQKAEE
ncbi:unnamed protein product [Sordaria macrospora k-hell]|uniref:WGS project CABT00000000 data, contig 2.6 n=1 Tax=Sordaria macrospora (strain ATCC MYA-333 / DSM 997 / K(L3346) / K-hell) TaxID=771870 RepID=F7VT34_SORMK|nr:uncharacterized protein SMAC_05734 [Sordaria macrospora k-hell]CCC08489.1 unnamed protein product [Sordaria macrospora k-hell]